MPGVGRGNNPNSRKTQFKKASIVAKIPSNKRSVQDRIMIERAEVGIRAVNYGDRERYKRAIERVGVRGLKPVRESNLKQALLTSAKRGMVDPKMIRQIEQMDNTILNEMHSVLPVRLESVYKYEGTRIDDPGSDFHGANLPIENSIEVEKMIRSYDTFVEVRKSYGN